ncbi:MAG: indole-3-glycerol-phosphate synthase [Peptococcaceae bacterium]|nr:indole-3-glycerol-phosphate synthase [Candidatus Syntrophopropionicum ammoniitolerans]
MKGLRESLEQKLAGGSIPIIPDIKIRSPKEGNLFLNITPLEAAQLMEKLGAPAISVVSEQKYFGGSLQLLEEVALAVSLPVLRKDFIKEENDLYRTKNCGATAVLLICACLSEKRLRMLYDLAIGLSLEPLVEVHTRDELALADSIGAKLIGINNRQILALEKDNGSVSVTQKLAPSAPQEAFLISESGITTPEQAKAAIKAGAGSVLVGTAIWKSPDPGEFYVAMSRGEGKKNEQA